MATRSVLNIDQILTKEKLGNLFPGKAKKDEPKKIKE